MLLDPGLLKRQIAVNVFVTLYWALKCSFPECLTSCASPGFRRTNKLGSRLKGPKIFRTPSAGKRTD